MDEIPREEAPPAPRSSTWSPVALISFAVIAATLAAVGLLGFYHRAPAMSGAPDDPAVRAALAALGGGVEFSTGDLRFATSMDSGERAGTPPGGPQPSRLAEAERRLIEARKRRPDPRLDCLLGHLDLARHRYENAERRYAAALDRASRYGEARLGLGVTLALHAQTEGDLRKARALNLRAIAQLAAVERNDPFHLPALYDRVVLLTRVGRPAEALACARAYLEIEPRGAWSASLLRMLEGMSAARQGGG